MSDKINVAYVNETKPLTTLEQTRNNLMHSVKHQQKLVKLIEFLEANPNVAAFLDQNNAQIYFC